MGTVTKPIILDETGQSIVGVLQDIADAIPPHDLNDLADVAVASPVNNQVLMYNSSTQKWYPLSS